MSINGPGASLDMATSEENVPETMPIKSKDSVQWGTFYDPKTIVYAPKNKKMDEKDIKEIQNYFSNPDDDLKSLLDHKYLGPIDGKINNDLKTAAEKLEISISSFIGKKIDGMVLNTTINDLKSAIKKVAAYKKYLKNEANQYKKMSLDERFYKLSQLICLKK